MMSTLIARSDGTVVQLTTGGSDMVLARCEAQLLAAQAVAWLGTQGVHLAVPLLAA